MSRNYLLRISTSEGQRSLEATALIKQGFQYITEMDGFRLFRKRKYTSPFFFFPLSLCRTFINGTLPLWLEIGYDELFAVFAFLESVFGVVASVFPFPRRRYRLAFAAAFCSMVSGTGLLITSLIQPFAVLWQSLLYYFLPVFLPPLITKLLVYYRNAEFR